MKLPLANEEQKLLKTLHQSLVQSQRDFQVALSATLASRDIPVATFQGFDGADLVVELPPDA